MQPKTDKAVVGTTKVSSVGVGTISWFADSSKGQQNINEVVTAALDADCTFFDTAERYGSNKAEVFGGGWGTAEKVLSRYRGLTIATKFTPAPWRRDANSVVTACEESCKRLGVEAVDLYQIHMPDIVQPLRVFGITEVKDELYWEGLAECYRRGLARNVGVSNYGHSLLLKASEKLGKRGVHLASNQINYSLLYRENGAQQTVDIGTAMGIKTLAYFPLAMGLLSGKHNNLFPKEKVSDMSSSKTAFELSELRNYQAILPLLQAMQTIAEQRNKTIAQVALNWVICKGAIPIAGCRTKQQVVDNLGARGWRLTSEEVTALEQIAERLGATFEGAGFKRSGEKFVGYGLEKWSLD